MEVEEETNEDEESIDFMRKSRFERVKGGLGAISPKAQKVIDDARDEDVLMLTMKFNSPTLSIVDAEVCDADRFIEMAF